MASPSPKMPARKKGKKNPTTTLWIIISALLVAVVGIAAVIAFTGDNKPITAAPSADLEQYRPVTVTGVPLAPMDGSATDPAVGTQAPEIVGASFDGTPVSIKPGAPTLVVLLAHWCPHCQREVPRLVDWNKAGKLPAGVNVVGIATGTSPDKPNFPPSSWLSTEGWPWPVLADSGTRVAADALGLTGFPTFVFLDAQGKVLFRTSGEVEMTTLSGMIAKSMGA
ncbi:unannotated protein [freshwater metagenome]|uniref:Unannotated protein n=1 Tax=freshwater metagenome TaxID=449393 RepID=A0A6J7E777_9ZZZZ